MRAEWYQRSACWVSQEHTSEIESPGVLASKGLEGLSPAAEEKKDVNMTRLPR